MARDEEIDSETGDSHPRVKPSPTQGSGATPIYTSGGAGPFCLPNELRIQRGL